MPLKECPHPTTLTVFLSSRAFCSTCHNARGKLLNSVNYEGKMCHGAVVTHTYVPIHCTCTNYHNIQQRRVYQSFIAPFLWEFTRPLIWNCVQNYQKMLYAQTRSHNKKLSCRRETARRFVSLSILLSHSRSFEMTMLSRACLSSISLKLRPYLVPFLRYSASKNGVTLKPAYRSRSRSLKMFSFVWFSIAPLLYRLWVIWRCIISWP